MITAIAGIVDTRWSPIRYREAVWDDQANCWVSEAEAAHRDHAIIEQVIADLKVSAPAHLPSGVFSANAAWLACAMMAYNLTQAAGALAGLAARPGPSATLRTRLINVAARVAGFARRLVLHLPEHWLWEAGLEELFRRTLLAPNR